MQKSEQINELATALAKAQAKIETAKKDITNSFYRSQYAGLPQVWEACRAALTSNGLSVVQCTDTSEHGIVLETTLLHSSGQWISSVYPINPLPDKEGRVTPQGIGSAITYSRRYSLMAIVGVVADDASDDDGNTASGIHTPSKQAEVIHKPSPATIADRFIEAISDQTTAQELKDWSAKTQREVLELKQTSLAEYGRVSKAYYIALDSMKENA